MALAMLLLNELTGLLASKQSHSASVHASWCPLRQRCGCRRDRSCWRRPQPRSFAPPRRSCICLEQNSRSERCFPRRRPTSSHASGRTRLPARRGDATPTGCIPRLLSTRRTRHARRGSLDAWRIGREQSPQQHHADRRNEQGQRTENTNTHKQLHDVQRSSLGRFKRGMHFPREIVS